MKKGKNQGSGRGAGKFPQTGSYYAIRRYCLEKGVRAFSYDEFEDRLPRPKKKGEPTGAKIIVRKKAAAKKNHPEEVKSSEAPGETLDKENSGKTAPKDEYSEVKQLEKELIYLIRAITPMREEKSRKSRYQDLLAQIYYKVEELIGKDPAKAKSPLSDELQEMYVKLCVLV